jgi:hypothetical protein
MEKEDLNIILTNLNPLTSPVTDFHSSVWNAGFILSEVFRTNNWCYIRNTLTVILTVTGLCKSDPCAILTGYNSHCWAYFRLHLSLKSQFYRGTKKTGGSMLIRSLIFSECQNRPPAFWKCVWKSFANLKKLQEELFRSHGQENSCLHKELSEFQCENMVEMFLLSLVLQTWINWSLHSLSEGKGFFSEEIKY